MKILHQSIAGFVIFVFFTSLCAPVIADETAQPESAAKHRAVVGLVLSGGGARGLSHIGALEWLEQHRIPVDYLSGTSIGGLIGGLYAMGMSPKEMREFIHGIDWKKVFNSGVNYEELSFRRKQDRHDYRIGLEMGLKNGLSLPTGLSTGHEVGLIIDRATLPYSRIKSFDDLPIPFRCMGADLLAAKPVLMKDGLLSTAMRATMSLPGIFPPVKRDGKWLIDGGTLNNIPTDVMRDLHPDVIIAVNVGTPLGDEKVTRSMLGVLSQTVGVITYGSDQERLKLADIVVTPELGNITVTDFENIDATADLGYAAAEKQSAALIKYSVDEATWQEYLAQKNAKRLTQIPTPQGLAVEGVPPLARDEVQYRLREFLGKPLATKDLESELTHLTGEGRYESIDYGFINGDGGKDVLQIRVRPKTYAPPTLNFSLTIEGSDISEFNFGAGARITFYDLGLYGSEWRSDLDMGFASRLATEYYVPVGHKGFFLAPSAYYNRGKQSLFSGGTRVADYQVNRYGLGADIGFLRWRNEVRVGYEVGRIDASLSSGTAPISSLAGHIDFARAQWTFDGLNSATIPTDGMGITASSHYYFSSPDAAENFLQGETTASLYHPVSTRGTVFGTGAIGTTFNKDAAPAQKFTLGGPFKLGAFDRDQFVGNHYLLFSAGYMHQIYELPPLAGGKVWVLAFYTVGSAFDDFSNINYENQGSIALALDTRLGPFALVAAYGEGGNGNVYFSFGKFF